METTLTLQELINRIEDYVSELRSSIPNTMFKEKEFCILDLTLEQVNTLAQIKNASKYARISVDIDDIPTLSWYEETPTNFNLEIEHKFSHTNVIQNTMDRIFFDFPKVIDTRIQDTMFFRENQLKLYHRFLNKDYQPFIDYAKTFLGISII